MMNLRKRIGSCLSIDRAQKNAVRWIAVFAVFAIAYALVFPAITKTNDMTGRLDDVGVRIEAANDAVPADTALVLNRVLLPGAGEEEGLEDEASRRLTEQEVQQILAAAQNGDSTLKGEILEALDISLEHKGSEIEPADAVRLRIQSDLIRKARQPAIVHLDEAGNATLFTALDKDGETICFDNVREESAAPARDENPTVLAKSEASAAKSVDELSGMTDSFSVYAIVDLVANSQSSEENVSTEPFEFNDSVGNVDVHVTAPATAFPAGTTMRLAMVDAADVMNTVSQAVGGEIAVVQAVDIAFCNADGVEIEPSEPINVVMRPHDTGIDVENSKLVHIGAEETTVVDNASFDEEQVAFASDEFSTYAIIIILGAPGEHIYEGNGVTIKVSYGKEAGLPDGTEMVIRELEQGTEEYKEYFARTKKALNMDTDEISMENISLEAQLDFLFSGGYKLTDARIYDIELFHNGVKIEPAAPVNVEIHYDDADEVDAENMKIVHFANDGTEVISDLDVKTTRKSGATISYQQGSFSQTAIVVAQNYGNGGWWYTKAFNSNTPTYRLRFRYKDGIFELGYPGNYKKEPKKDNADWSWPGDSGYPFTGGAGQLDKGTTIEQILRALAQHGDPTYCNTVTGVDFLMYGTYTVDNENFKANGNRLIADDYGAQETEVWTGEFHNTWYKKDDKHPETDTNKPATGAWKMKSISINRASDFNGPLIHIKSSGSHPVHARSNVVINNGASPKTAVLIEDGALLMMEENAHIIGGVNKNNAVGTGVYLDKGGSVEFFDQSFVTNMNVAVEQKNGKTRLKTSPNPFGETNGRAGMNDGNKTGVALWPGQSIGKWTENLSDAMKPVPILLRELDKWKSGDIVMDSGRWWLNEKYPGQAHNEMYGAVVDSDLGSGNSKKFYFQNPQDGVNMALEYYSGGKTYTSQTVTNEGGNKQIIAPGECYPVIRFTRGTVYNQNTNTWYRTLYDAVNNENNMGPGASPRKVKSDDILIFFGSTVEDRIITIPGDVTNLTIRTSNEQDLTTNDNRRGDACTAEIKAGIVIENGASVTFQNGGKGDLTLNGSGAETIITNKGTLNLKEGVTLSGAQYGIEQNGTFNLYEGVTFSGNKTADVCLGEKDKNAMEGRYITLQTANPTTSVSVKLGNGVNKQFHGRDVVVQGNSNVNLNENFCGKFPLKDKEDAFTYVYRESGGPNGAPALELKEAGKATIKIFKVEKEAPDVKIPGTKFTINGNEYTTDSNGQISVAVLPGSYKIEEIEAAPQYIKGDVGYEIQVVNGVEEDTFRLEGSDAEKFVSEDNVNFSITVENEPKTVNVQFVKSDDNGKPLAEAEFELYNVNPDTTADAKPAYTGSSDASGNIKWTSNQEKLPLRVQDYWLVETKTPAGYTPLPLTKITIRDNNGNYEVEKGDNPCVTSEKENDGTIKITVVNNPGKPLPHTGGIGTAIYTAIGLILIGIAGLAFLAVSNRRKGYRRV